MNTRGFIGLGFSYKSEKIGDADIILAWVDDRTGVPNVLVNISKVTGHFSARHYFYELRLYFRGEINFITHLTKFRQWFVYKK